MEITVCSDWIFAIMEEDSIGLSTTLFLQGKQALPQSSSWYKRGKDANSLTPGCTPVPILTSEAPSPGKFVNMGLAKKRGPSAERWATHRNIIESLYIQQGKELHDVSKIMRQTHGFIATSVI